MVTWVFPKGHPGVPLEMKGTFLSCWEEQRAPLAFRGWQ